MQALAVLLTFALMRQDMTLPASQQAKPGIVQVKLGAVHREIMNSGDRFTEVEGAMRSGKTWTCLMKERRALEQYPGIHSAMAMWTEGNLNQKLLPDWRNVCELMQVSHGEWIARESCYEFPNKSRIYAVHLKTGQNDNKYAAVRGLTVARFYVCQFEEVPEDVGREAMLRLSQPGYPQQFTADANPVPDGHWIAKEWPAERNKPDHRYIRATIWDNRHNLDPKTIQAAEALYPPGHPQRRTKLEGKRGLDVSGTPVYFGAFQRSRHVRNLDCNPNIPLIECYDYGFHHPCVLWLQWAPWGWLRVLGGVMASDMHLDAFLPVVERYRDLWFPRRGRLLAFCDPAGAAENSQGLSDTPVGVLSDWFRELGERDEQGKPLVPQYQADANHPENRWTANQRAATYMRRQVNGDEAFLVDPERWMLAELDDERFDSFFIDGLDVGYVLEPEARHSQKLGSFWMPVKDGAYEHAQNCFEYGVLGYVRELPRSGSRVSEAAAKHDAMKARQESLELKRQQRDADPYDRRLRPAGTRGRAGYG